MNGGHGADGAVGSALEFWDDHYRSAPHTGSFNLNPTLVDEVADIPPGHALDLGCGGGADAIWLAERGWQVTGIDVSPIVLHRAAENARRAGTDDRIRWESADLTTWTPPADAYDLVSSHFLHSSGGLPYKDVLRRASLAVRPGGTLLVVGHASIPAASRPSPASGTALSTPSELVESLGLADPNWSVQVAESRDRSTMHDGKTTVHPVTVLRAQRVSR